VSSFPSDADTDARPPCPDYPPALGESRLLTDEELRASLECTLRDWDRQSDLWLFGYGSLIWNPGLPTVEATRSKVHGYHRGLYLWSRVNRGTPEQPGLVLALDRGGSCTGIAFRLAAEGAMPHPRRCGAAKCRWVPTGPRGCPVCSPTAGASTHLRS
jgi:cation transport protein ChaC